jgi:hypothetical protein
MPPVPPILNIYPPDGTTDMPTRDCFRINAIRQGAVALNPATAVLTLTVGGLAIPLIRAGVPLPGWAIVLTGDVLDMVDGVWVRVFPPAIGTWEAGTEYVLDAFIADLAAASATAHAHVITADHVCIEDELPTPTALELRLMNGPLTTNLEHLRKNLLQAISTSKNKQAQARAMLNTAYATDLFSILATWVDTDLCDTHVCNKSGPVTVALKMAKQIADYKSYLNELTPLSKASRDLLENRINHVNVLYAVNALAVTVVLGAVFKEKGWL